MTSTDELPNVDACLPVDGPIREYIDWVRQTSKIPVIFHLGSILVCAAHMVARYGFRVPPRGGVPHVWVFIAAPSASGKSTAAGQAQTFFETVCEKGSAPDPFVSADGSVEGVMYNLAGLYDEIVGRTVAILHHDELSQVFYKRGVEPNLCRLFDEKNVTRNTMKLQMQKEDDGKDRTVVTAPAVQFIGLTTAVSLEQVFTKATQSGGFFNRGLWLSAPAEESVSDVDDLFHNAYKKRMQPPDELVESWVRWFGELDGYQCAGLESEIYFDPAIQEPLTQWLREYVEPYEERSEMDQNNLVGRIKQHLTTVAAVYAVSRGSVWGDRVVITREDAEPAFNLIRFSLGKMIMLSKTLAVDELTRWRQRVRTKILEARVDGATKSDLYKIDPRLRKDILDQVIDTLVDQGEVVKKSVRVTDRGRPKEIIVAAPFVGAWMRKYGEVN